MTIADRWTEIYRLHTELAASHYEDEKLLDRWLKAQADLAPLIGRGYVALDDGHYLMVDDGCSEEPYIRCVSYPPPGSLRDVTPQVMKGACRPTWDNFFFGLAFDYSRRSRDGRTKHGCVIVDPRNNHIIGTGYNSFLAGLPDEKLPTEAPAKYIHMDHSEVNATSSLTRDPWGIPGGAIAYITGTPCYPCARDLVRHNVLHWKVADRPGHRDRILDHAEHTTLVIENRQVRVEVCQPKLNWLFDESFRRELAELGFL